MTKHALPSILLAVAACGGSEDNPDIPTQNRAVVVSGDFTPGSPGVMSALDLETQQMDQRVAPNGAVGSDPVIRRVGGELFVVNRADGNNVTILDAITFELIDQLATGPGSNPQDVAVVGDRLFLPALGTTGVVVIDRTTATSTTIDLGALDTSDGMPDCMSAFAIGERVFVACGLLDGFAAVTPGKIAVIDTANGDAQTVIDMQTANPFALFERAPNGDLAIATVPDFVDFSVGCVEHFSTGSTPAALGCSATNADLGGFVARLGYQDNIEWVVVSSFDTEQHGNLQGFDLDAGGLLGAPISTDTQVLTDLAVCPDNTVVVADGSIATNGLRVYTEAGEQTADPLPVGLRPASPHGLACY
jgi:hypothetical protein